MSKDLYIYQVKLIDAYVIILYILHMHVLLQLYMYESKLLCLGPRILIIILWLFSDGIPVGRNCALNHYPINILHPSTID